MNLIGQFQCPNCDHRPFSTMPGFKKHQKHEHPERYAKKFPPTTVFVKPSTG